MKFYYSKKEKWLLFEIMRMRYEDELSYLNPLHILELKHKKAIIAYDKEPLKLKEFYNVDEKFVTVIHKFSNGSFLITADVEQLRLGISNRGVKTKLYKKETNKKLVFANVDATYNKEKNVAGVGGIIKSKKGIIISRFANLVLPIKDVTELEFIGLVELMKRTQDKHKKVVFQIDSFNVINLLKKKRQNINRSKYLGYIKTIKGRYLKNNPNWSIRYVKRDKNIDAHNTCRLVYEVSN